MYKDIAMQSSNLEFCFGETSLLLLLASSSSVRVSYVAIFDARGASDYLWIETLYQSLDTSDCGKMLWERKIYIYIYIYTICIYSF